MKSIKCQEQLYQKFNLAILVWEGIIVLPVRCGSMFKPSIFHHSLTSLHPHILSILLVPSHLAVTLAACFNVVFWIILCLKPGPQSHKSFRWKSTEIPPKFHRKSTGFPPELLRFLANERRAQGSKDLTKQQGLPSKYFLNNKSSNDNNNNNNIFLKMKAILVI